jgi:hypothetical protein
MNDEDPSTPEKKEPRLEPDFPFFVLPFDPAFFGAIDTPEENEAES